MSASSSTSSPPPASPASLAALATKSEHSPVPAALEQNDTNLEDTTVLNAPTESDGDSEATLWDIIADSHPDLESYMDPHYNQEMSYQPAVDTPSLISSGLLPLTTNSAFSTPSYYITVDTRLDGTPFPLSKPIAREDGVLFVGTELVGTELGEKNRIFTTNFLSSSDTEVRDLQWVDTHVAIAAVGHDIQLIQLGPFRVQEPITSVHSDVIRELAVSNTTSSYVLSGGFDETVVVTDLRSTADPMASTAIAKYDARDVVSSVRWSPAGASQVSWTTDGGDFQAADSRVPSPQLQVPLHKYLHVGKLGGLFAHEYLSDFSVALGFESGYVAMLDLRLPRHSFCTSLVESRLTAIGEIRRSGTKLAMFGRSGFSTAELTATADSIDHITLRQQPTQIAATSYKTSGDFSFESGAHLAVSDNMGIVSVYTDNNVFGSGSGGW
ncbi:WD40/YVTN repeat-like-containing domain [Phytophthora cinnamomi]|uniref:WD40/YVTN repeat-like-containing domain n=1 Tax=Phytophthora cinnamomi TaxID=4785 RepID=UPI00355938A0|nr:WD40/YVTN repeat-like-containing domain [Phytophthora cinnamomi]